MKRIRERVGVRWYPRSAYASVGMPWRIWIYASAHDDDSWFWRVLGLEITIVRIV